MLMRRLFDVVLLVVLFVAGYTIVGLIDTIQLQMSELAQLRATLDECGQVVEFLLQQSQAPILLGPGA